MKLRFQIFTVACLLAALLSACQTTPPPKPIVKPQQMLTLDEVAQALTQRQESIRNVKSLVKTRVTTREDNHNLKQILAIDGDTALRMDTLNLFNQPLGVLISKDGHILLFDTDSQKLYRDAEVWDIMIRIFGAVFDFREYIHVFSGRIPRLASLEMKDMQWSPETGNYHIHATDPQSGVRLEIEVDPQTLLPVRLIKRQGERELYRALWENYQTAGGEIPFPFKITVERPAQGDSVALKFNDPLLNQGVPPDTFELSVPESD